MPEQQGGLEGVAKKHNFNLDTLNFADEQLTLANIDLLRSDLQDVSDSRKQIILEKLSLLESTIYFYNNYFELTDSLELSNEPCTYETKLNDTIQEGKIVLDEISTFNYNVAMNYPENPAYGFSNGFVIENFVYFMENELTLQLGEICA